MSETLTGPAAQSSTLTLITAASRAEAAAAANKIALVKEFQEAHPNPDDRSSLEEIAMALSTTYAVVADWLRISFELERMPEIAAAFTDGLLTLPAVQAVTEHTCGAPLATIVRLEPRILDAAQTLPPRKLGTEIDRLLAEDDPDWASRAHERAKGERNVKQRPLARGMGRVTATLTATETAEVSALITAVAKTVCHGDPRSITQRRADAYLALMRGQSCLGCQCGDPACEYGPAQPMPRPEIRLTLMCGLATVLGIGRNPAHLEGYGALDPETTRALAADATWQAIIDTAERAVDSFDGPYAHGTILVSPIMPAGTVAAPSPYGFGSAQIAQAHDLLARLRQYVLDFPHTVHAEFPDGHGGFTQPPPGALAYRPSAALADAVRLRDGTCRHPGCCVPAADCQIDHIQEYDHSKPVHGGWTILANLQCLCARHHALKTAKLWDYGLLRHGIVHARSTLGQHGFSLPANLD
ncbi:DUF222 domain-containing protein [Skermania sp. ID1734]|uniref:HNH endonuclease signature motif containing protein n=1 Tax=Skermania sp. ID1734 TaxID=2597516 RepID=UPI00117F6D3A|nr:HNH endonuclease signature motif containing protein [Skermania sp. ID1734]TSE01118.1 DUF222 domain-containing protein [Skermania sp. ID1734]